MFGHRISVHIFVERLVRDGGAGVVVGEARKEDHGHDYVAVHGEGEVRPRLARERVGDLCWSTPGPEE